MNKPNEGKREEIIIDNIKPMIVDFLNKYLKHNNKSVSVHLMQKNIKAEKEIIYQSLFSLLDEGVIEKVYVSSCPVCNGKVYFTDEKQENVTCPFCGETYYAYIGPVDEEFKIKGK